MRPHSPITPSWTETPAYRIYSIDQAKAAFAAAASGPVHLLSPIDSVAQHGSAWFVALCQQAAQHLGRPATIEDPSRPWRAFLHCHQAPGHGIAALQSGADGILLTGCHNNAVQALSMIAKGTCQQVQTVLPPIYAYHSDGWTRERGLICAA